MKIVSWNVNGLRAVAKKGFVDWLNTSGADVVGIQEVRATLAQLPNEIAQPPGWHLNVVAAERPGYSGVGLYSKVAPSAIESSLGDPQFDGEGRLQMASFGSLLIANGYFPNGNGKERDNSRIPYKLAFYQRLFEVLEPARKAGRPILVMGDFNTAHKEIDLARPKANEQISGFRPEEREELDRWIRSGWTDTFRVFDSSPNQYSWWSARFGVREKNIGWRIDYVLASEGVLPYLKDAFIWQEVMGSDHCPVGVTVDEAICSVTGSW